MKFVKLRWEQCKMHPNIYFFTRPSGLLFEYNMNAFYFSLTMLLSTSHFIVYNAIT